MDKLYDSSYDVVLTSYGQAIDSQLNPKIQTDSDSETLLRLITEPDKERLLYYDNFLRYLKYNVYFTGTINAWLIPPSRQDDYSVPFIGADSLTSSGDHSWSPLGISGDGSYYFDTINPSTDITDINNFSIFLYVQDNTNVGIDLDANDTTNFLRIQTRASGNANFRVGTEMETFVNTDSTGLWCLNVRSGSFYIYLNGVEVGGGGTAVGGSLPNQTMVLGGTNTSGTKAGSSDKAYSFLKIYNGALTETQVEDLSLHIEYLHTNFLRGNAIT